MDAPFGHVKYYEAAAAGSSANDRAGAAPTVNSGVGAGVAAVGSDSETAGASTGGAYLVELKYGGQEATLVEEELEIANQRQRAAISFVKFLKEDGRFGFEAANAYKQIRFGLFAGEKIIAADGTFIPEDGLIEIAGVEAPAVLGAQSEAATGALYYGSFTADVPFGSYYVREIATANGYILTDERFPLEFVYDEENGKLAEITINNGLPLTNEIIRGSLEIVKSGENGAPLAGAEFGLFPADSAEEQRTAEFALMTGATGLDGRLLFENVPYGEYLLVELQAPAGHLPVADVKVGIEEEGVVKELHINDPALPPAPEPDEPAPPQTGDGGAGRLALWLFAAALGLTGAGSGLAATRADKHRRRS